MILEVCNIIKETNSMSNQIAILMLITIIYYLEIETIHESYGLELNPIILCTICLVRITYIYYSEFYLMTKCIIIQRCVS